MKLSNRQLGILGEDFAQQWLTRHGYQILDRNWRGSRVELDLVARKNNLIIFVEVKTRSSNYCGHPAEAVTYLKLQNIKSAALQWLNSHNLKSSGIRIDVLALQFDGESFQVTHIPGVS